MYLANEKKLAPGSILIAAAALRFLYRVTLHKDWPFEDIIPARKKSQTLPVVLSPEEVLHFLSCVEHIKHRTILSTCYASGLRMSEAVSLKPCQFFRVADRNRGMWLWNLPAEARTVQYPALTSIMLRFIATFLLIHLLMGTGLGQTIQGMVTDSTGATIPGVSITARNIAGGLPRPVITVEAGKYLVPSLRAGTYVLIAELPGFEVERREVVLISVGSVWNFSMPRSGIAPGDGQLSVDELRTRAIMKELHDLGRDALPALVLGLQDPAVQLRQNAALILLNLGGGFSGVAQPKIDVRETLPALIAALDDSDGLVRAWSAQAIGQIGPDAAAAVPALITLLANADEGSRNSSCIALRQIGPAASLALPALQRALNDSSADVRQFAQLAIQVIQKK